MIHEQNENVKYKEIETIKKSQAEILKLKNTITEVKNSPEEFNTDLIKQNKESENLKIDHLNY